MDSQPSPRGVTSESPFNAMLKAAFAPSAGVGLVCAVVFFVMHGLSGGVSALFGAALALVFFASGLLVLRTLRQLSPVAIMSAAMAVFFAQVIVLGLVLAAARRVKDLDGPATGITVAVVVVAWQIFQVRSFLRTRQFVYDPEVGETGAELGGHA